MPYLRAKLKSPLVMGRHAHQRAAAVVVDHVVGHPHRDRLARDRIEHADVQLDAVLLAVGVARVNRQDLQGPFAELLDLRIALACGGGQRMAGVDRHVGHAHQGVRPGRVDLDLLEAGGGLGQREPDAHALAAADQVYCWSLTIFSGQAIFSRPSSSSAP